MKFQIIDNFTELMNLVKSAIDSIPNLQQQTEELYQRTINQSPDYRFTKSNAQEYILNNAVLSVLRNYLIHIDKDIYIRGDDVIDSITPEPDSNNRFIRFYSRIPIRDAAGLLTHSDLSDGQWCTFKSRIQISQDLNPLINSHTVSKLKYTTLSEGSMLRIIALKDFRDVKTGDLGGLIENLDNLSQDGNCWVYDNAVVRDNAKIKSNAIIAGDASIHGNASISGDAIIRDRVNVGGNAVVHGNALIYGDVTIYGNCAVYGTATISGATTICENVVIHEDAFISGNIKIHGNSVLGRGTQIT